MSAADTSNNFGDVDNFNRRAFPRGAGHVRVPSGSGNTDFMETSPSSIELPSISRATSILATQDPSQQSALWRRFIVAMLAPFDYAPDTNLTHLYPAKYSVMRRDNYNSLPPWRRDGVDASNLTDFARQHDTASPKPAQPTRANANTDTTAGSDAEKAYEARNGSRYVTDVSLNDSPRIVANNANANNVAAINITTPTVVEPLPSSVSPYRAHRLLGEFLGVFFITLTAGFNQEFPQGIMLAGLLVMVAIFVSIPVSGGHLNSGVTIFSATMNGRFTRDDGLYLLVQAVGSCLGFLIAWALSPENMPQPVPGVYTVRTNELSIGPHLIDYSHIHPIIIFFSEAFSNAMFAPILCATAPAINGTVSATRVLGLGVYMVAGLTVLARVSGAMQNPTVGFGFALMHLCYFGPNEQFFLMLLYYVFSPCMGGFLGGVFGRMWNKWRQEERIMEEQLLIENESKLRY